MRFLSPRVLLFSLAPVGLLLGSLELAGRRISGDRSPGGLIPHETRGWSLPADTEFEFAGRLATTNHLGLRSPEPSPAPHVRVLSVGDSAVFGHGVDDDETYSARLAALSGADVQNAGVPGYTCEQSLEWSRELADTLDPDILLLYTLHNDVRIIESSDDTWLKQAHSSSGIIRVLALAKRHQMAYRRQSRMSVADYEACLRDIVDAQTARGGTSVLLTPFTLRDFEKRELEKTWVDGQDREPRGGSGRDRQRGWRRAYRTAIEEVSAQTGALHIDLQDLVWTKGSPETEILLDEVHPTALGHDLIAAHLHQALTEHGSLSAPFSAESSSSPATKRHGEHQP